MENSRIFEAKGPFTLREISTETQSKLNDLCDADISVHDIFPLNAANNLHLSFLENPKYVEDFRNTNARAVIVDRKNISLAPDGVSLLISENPYKSYALAAQMFYPLAVYTEPNISLTSQIHETAIIGMNCQIGNGVTVQSGAVIGPTCSIGENTVIGEKVVVGSNCRVGANVTITHSRVGNGVMIHNGAVLGQAGFGFAMDNTGHTFVPQVGLVIVKDNVRIGANTTIDRGANTDTVIGGGCIIDNLVQIAHNVRLGENCVIAAQSGISGSTQLGDFVIIGGQVGIAGHLRIGDGVKIAGKSGITKDIPSGETYGGIPGVPIKEWRQQVASIKRLAKRIRNSI